MRLRKPKYFYLCWCTLIASFALGCRTLSRSPQDSEIPGTYYRVKSGDTLAAIARTHKLGVDEIKDINGIENNHALRVGQNLYLPDPDPIGTKMVSLAKKNPPSPSSPSPKVLPSSAQAVLDWPVPGGKIFREYSRAKLNPYDGIGISAARGTPVVAALSGRVLFVGDDGTKFGLLVILEHASSLITVYTHLDKALVKTGQSVDGGAHIGTVGVSGGVSSPRLHFQVRVDQRPQNPKAFFKSALAKGPLD